MFAIPQPEKQRNSFAGHTVQHRILDFDPIFAAFDGGISPAEL
jgi:hypothetical protein